MTGAIALIQALVGERRLGRRAPVLRPGVGAIGSTA
jgi:hypothetical protein